MTRITKLSERLIANPNALISFLDFETLLRAFWFDKHIGNGSHSNYRHPTVP